MPAGFAGVCCLYESGERVGPGQTHSWHSGHDWDLRICLMSEICGWGDPQAVCLHRLRQIYQADSLLGRTESLHHYCFHPLLAVLASPQCDDGVCAEARLAHPHPYWDTGVCDSHDGRSGSGRSMKCCVWPVLEQETDPSDPELGPPWIGQQKRIYLWNYKHNMKHGGSLGQVHGGTLGIQPHHHHGLVSSCQWCPSLEPVPSLAEKSPQC